MKEIAEKRLAAIQEYTDWIGIQNCHAGSGNPWSWKSAWCQQHGHMEAVGYDMYCKMLNEAVKHLKGEQSERGYIYDSIGCQCRCVYSDSYIPNEYHKLDIYKRIAAIESEGKRWTI